MHRANAKIGTARAIPISLVFILCIFPFIIGPIWVHLGGTEKAFFVTDSARRLNFYTTLKAWILLGLALVLFLRWMAIHWREKLKLNLVETTVLILMGIAAASSAASAYSDVVLWGMSTRSEGLLTWLSYGALFLGVYRFYDLDRGSVVGAAKLFAFTLLPMGVLAISQVYGNNLIYWFWILISPHSPLLKEMTMNTVYGTFGNANYLGSYLAMAVPIAIGLSMIEPDNAIKMRLQILGAFGFLTAILTQNLGIACVLSTLLVASALFLPTIKSLKRISMISLAYFSVLTLGVAMLLIAGNNPDKGILVVLSGAAGVALIVEILRNRCDTVMLRRGILTVLITVLTVGSVSAIGSYQRFAASQYQGVYYYSLEIDNTGVLKIQTDKGWYQLYSETEGVVVLHDGLEIARYTKGKLGVKKADPLLEELDFTQEENSSFVKIKKIALFEMKEGTVWFHRKNARLEKVDNPPHLNVDYMEGAGNFRAYIWSRGIPAAWEHAALGGGPDTFAFNFPQYEIAPRLNTKVSAQVDKPHNLYLQLFSNFGLVFTSVYVLGVSLVSLKAFKRKNDIASVLLAGVVGYMLIGIVNDSYVQISPMFYVLLGMMSRERNPL